ncbi:MAG: hypothetical protein HQ567_23295 [Candidatus Nealsonbacteria bacterium]|nr:hypothetical protein [Candidatus Nealsonbacteria bacterium]
MMFSTSQRRRGNIMVLTAVLMVPLLGLLAFAIDLGYIMNARTELQRTADACALAAARVLPDQADAVTVAQSFAQQNYANVGPDLDASNVEFGFWDRDHVQFIVPPPSGMQPNAVRVTLERTAGTGNPLGMFFARVLGADTADTAASATATYDRALCGPFVGIESLSIPGNPQTDSYDSEKGLYGSSNPGHQGSICSDGPISVEGTAFVRGHARAGKGHGVTQTGTTEISRSKGSRLKPLVMPPVDASDAAVNNDNDQVPLILTGNDLVSPVDADGNFLLDGGKTITLPEGTYYFNDFTLAGNAVLNTTGKVVIYLTGDLYRGGLVLVTNSSKLASNLQILMTGGTAEVTSQSDFYGVIYAPNTPVSLAGGSDVFGAIVGKTLLVTGDGTGHYDESLELEGLEFPTRTSLVD